MDRIDNISEGVIDHALESDLHILDKGTYFIIYIRHGNIGIKVVICILDYTMDFLT